MQVLRCFHKLHPFMDRHVFLKYPSEVDISKPQKVIPLLKRMFIIMINCSIKLR